MDEHDGGWSADDDTGSGAVVMRRTSADDEAGRFGATLAGVSILLSLVPFGLALYWGAQAALGSGPTLNLAAKAVVALVLGLILLLNGRLLFPDRTRP